MVDKRKDPKGSESDDQLRAFLVDVATDPAALGRFVKDPETSMSDAGLSAEDQAVLRSGNPAAINARLAGGPGAAAGGPMMLMVVVDVAGEQVSVRPLLQFPPLQLVQQPPLQLPQQLPQLVQQVPPQLVFPIQPPPPQVVQLQILPQQVHPLVFPQIQPQQVHPLVFPQILPQQVHPLVFPQILPQQVHPLVFPQVQPQLVFPQIQPLVAPGPFGQ